MKHEIKELVKGEGLQETTQLVCSCGWSSMVFTRYSGHYYTNIHGAKQEHLKESLQGR